MSRRMAITVLALGCGLALTSCGQAKHADDRDNSTTPTSSVGNPAGDPNGGSPSTTFTLAPFDRTASFEGKQGSVKGGNTYTVNVQLGKPQKADPDLTASADDDPNSTNAVNIGVALSTIQQETQDDTRCLNPERDLVLPITLQITNTSNIAGAFPVNFGARGKDNQGIPPLTGIAVSMIYENGGTIECNTNAGVAESNSLPKLTFEDLGADQSGETTGFLVLHNAVQNGANAYKDYSLTVTTTEGNDLVSGYDTIDSLTGFDKPVESLPTNTTDPVTIGGELPLVK